MPTKRIRFWDATVVAAAITAGLGGIFAAVIALMQGDRDAAKAKLEAELTARKDRCEHAYSILTDESLSSALSAQDSAQLVKDELRVANACRLDR